MSKRLMIVLGLWFALSVLTNMALSGQQKHPITLVASGTSPAVIIIPSGSETTMKFATEELKKYIFEITGVHLQITEDTKKLAGTKILLTSSESPNTQAKWIITEDNLPQIDSDEYLIATDKDTLVIAGGCA